MRVNDCSSGPSSDGSPSVCRGVPPDRRKPGIESASRLVNTEPTHAEITCLIVDDHEVVREGLRLSLSRAPHIRVIGEASDGESAVALADAAGPTS